MPFGPPVCACCGSTEAVEAHHLYPRSDGCPDDLTVWLCAVCHGRAHGMARRVSTGDATLAGPVLAKAADDFVPRVLPATNALPAEGRTHRFDALAMEHGPTLAELRGRGLSWVRIARVMNDSGAPSVFGRQWTDATAEKAHGRFLALTSPRRDA
jgi:hypothetical protein